jgi:hypothetical protein
VGRPFKFVNDGNFSKTEREAATSELMGQLAALLPEKMRGIYAEQAQKPCEFLEFL